ncbi:aspartate/glutamate racemase family protein [Mesobacterium pallidum]|uniref:aspartate/glutamate racemase family protein n=1 Tax=Mesobacterium pallidum TaxID=2872037 RepID=UPI001EE2075C|nr:aspartate/glutamate racemase family protein [Mesobacterium pallidum]
MRILLINPNTSQVLTDKLDRAARAVLPPDVELVSVTAEEGFPYISSRAEAACAGVGVLDVLARRGAEVDAAVIAAFGDPGLLPAREAFDLPVTGMTEASMLSACMLGQRFAFVTFTPRMAPWYNEQVRQAELSARFAGTFTPDVPLGNIGEIDSDLRGPLVAECHRAVAAGADVLILSGAPLAGMAPSLRTEVDAVLIDPVQAAVLQAAALVRLAPLGASGGSYRRPPGKPSTGLPAALAKHIARDE